jgi:ceramide glucosyltransferase
MLMLVQAITFALTALGIIYCLLSLWALLKFQSRRRTFADSKFTPPISILKPLCGLDPHGYESLRSHCLQDYPEYEIIFGVSTSGDPAVAAVKRLIREFPNVRMRLIVCSSAFGMNFKVNNLLQMLPSAIYPYVLINDSDIDVRRDYLRRVISPLEDESVGIVTCLFRGVASRNVGSLLESMAISCDFVPGVLCAKEVERGIHFAMGSTMALHRNVLEQIGGFQGIVDYLADDYELGHRVSKAGFRVAIADCVVEHYIPNYSWNSFFQHQLRWARTVRSCRPEGYAGMVVTFALPWSLVALAIAPSLTLAWTVAAVSVTLRFIISVISGSLILRDRHVVRSLWLLPLRDCVALLVWLLAYTGSSVTWRGNKFELSNGKLRPA